MKKILSAVLAVTMIVCLLLTGCGQEGGEKPAEIVADEENLEISMPIPEEYSVDKADDGRMVTDDGEKANQRDYWCVVDKYYQSEANENAGSDLLNDPQQILKEAGMRYPEKWVVNTLADVRMEGDTDKYDGSAVTLRFPEVNGKERICAMGYIGDQWVRGVIEKATDDYADVSFETVPDLAVLFIKPEGEGFASPNGGSYIGKEGRIIEITDWPFELQDEYECVVDQQFQSEEEQEAAEKLMEDPASYVKQFRDGDGADWKLVLLVDVRLEGNLDAYDGSPLTVAFPEVRTNKDILVLHYANGQWNEEVDKYITNDYIGVRFTSLSPVAFFVSAK